MQIQDFSFNPTATAACMLFLSLLLFSGCSSEATPEVPDHIQQLDNLMVYPYKPESVPELELVPEVSFGDTDNVIIGSIEYMTVFDQGRINDRVAVDDQGRVYVGDFQQNTIHVFQPDGTWITSLGREGKGPGEFRFIYKMKIISDRLYVLDTHELRTNVFSLETLTHSETFSLNPENQNSIKELQGLFPDYYYMRNDESVLVGFKKPPYLDEDPQSPDPLLFYGMEDGKLQPDKVIEQKDLIYYTGTGDNRYHMFSFDFNPVSLRALANDDRLYTVRTDDFLIMVHSPDGKYIRSFYYPFEKREVVRRKLVNSESRGEAHRRILKTIDLPEHWPVVRSLMIDDENRLWVSVFTNSTDMDQWWILNEKGELQGRFTLSRTKWIREIRNGRIYTVEIDEDNGKFKVVRYRLESPENI